MAGYIKCIPTTLGVIVLDLTSLYNHTDMPTTLTGGYSVRPRLDTNMPTTLTGGYSVRPHLDTNMPTTLTGGYSVRPHLDTQHANHSHWGL